MSTWSLRSSNSFLDEHDDDVIRSAIGIAWSRALGAILVKFPDLFSLETDFPCPRLPRSAGASASQTTPETWGPWPPRSPIPDDVQDFPVEGDEFNAWLFRALDVYSPAWLVYVFPFVLFWHLAL